MVIYSSRGDTELHSDRGPQFLSVSPCLLVEHVPPELCDLVFLCSPGKGAAHQVGNLFDLGDVKKAVIETHMTVTTFTPQDGKEDIASPLLFGGRSNEF